MVSTARTNGKTTHGSDAAEYQALVKSFPPRPIRDQHQLRETWVQVERLLAKARRSYAEDDYLSMLSDMVEHWEAEHVKMPTLRGVDLIRELLDENQLPQRALVDIFGADSIVSEVLSGKRELQRKHIEGLAGFFNVSPAAFFPMAESRQSPTGARRARRPRSAAKGRATARTR
jgi:HTH-type transcriptional regulator/antitoxin HigA